MTLIQVLDSLYNAWCIVLNFEKGTRVKVKKKNKTTHTVNYLEIYYNLSWVKS